MLDPLAQYEQLVHAVQSGDLGASDRAVQAFDFAPLGHEYQLHIRALQYYYASQFHLAAREAEQAASLAAIHQNYALYPRSLVLLGSCAAILFDTDQAAEQFRRALDIYERQQDRVGAARALSSLANVYVLRGDTPAALDAAQRALAEVNGLDQSEPQLMFAINNVLGMIYVNLQVYALAATYFRACAQAAAEQRNRPALITASVNLCEAMSLDGDHLGALAELRQIIQQPEYAEWLSGHLLNTAAEISLRAGEREGALHYARQALALSQPAEDAEEYCRAVSNICAVDESQVSPDDLRAVIALSESDSRPGLQERLLQTAIAYPGFTDGQKLTLYYPKLVALLLHKANALREQTLQELSKKAEVDNARRLAAYEQQLRVQAEDTIQRQLEELERGRLFDSLTGLPNRVMLLAQVAQQTHGSTPFLLVTLDVNRFQLINDTYGHDLADEVLRVAAERLRLSLAPGELVARVGGDEFALILKVRGDVRAQLDRVIALVTQPVALGHQTVRLSMSAGAACWPEHAEDPEALRRASELALMDAKGQGEAAVLFDASAHAHAGLEGALALALARGEYELHYQPLVDTQTRQVVSAEALLRWHSTEHGMQAPGTFMPILERSDQIVEVGAWVLREACRAAQAWADRTVRVAVNLSARQFASRDLLDTVRGALRDSGLPPHRLELEITESLMMLNPDRTAWILRALRDDGVRVMLDDFGTGYSSLAYLSRFPLSGLKVDRSFVQQMMRDPRGPSAAIVRAMVSLSRDMGLELVAEGIETIGDLDAVQAEGIHVMQGYYFARPTRDWQPPPPDSLPGPESPA